MMEQASHADLRGCKRLVRKHALHSVMAARRFEQSGQVGLESYHHTRIFALNRSFIRRKLYLAPVSTKLRNAIAIRIRPGSQLKTI